MILSQTIETFVNQQLEGKRVFLVTVNVRPGNRIQVLIDGENGVQISDCVELSRAIEANFDREKEDYELEVSSVGIGAPLKMAKQYHINVGRTIMVMGQDLKKTKGKLLKASEEGAWVQIEAKKTKKKSEDTREDATVFFPYQDIKEARIKVSFD